MSAVQRIQRLSIEEYLAREREADIRHEYVDGEIFAMAGASREHILIAGNVHAALHGYLRGSPCRVLMTDMKVRINPANAFYYPDLLVSCTDMDAEPDSYYETESQLIFCVSRLRYCELTLPVSPLCAIPHFRQAGCVSFISVFIASNAISRNASACVRVTVGNPSRKRSSESPAFR